VPVINRISRTTYFYRINFPTSILIWSNFDTADSRPSVGIPTRNPEPIELFYAHIGGKETLARGLKTCKRIGQEFLPGFGGQKSRAGIPALLCANSNRARFISAIFDGSCRLNQVQRRGTSKWNHHRELDVPEFPRCNHRHGPLRR
jgi:hypothetical protein